MRASRPSSIEIYPLLDRLNFGHHSRIFVIENVAVQKEGAPDDRVAEVGDYVQRAGATIFLTVRNDHAIAPVWMRDCYTIEFFTKKWA